MEPTWSPSSKVMSDTTPEVMAEDTGVPMHAGASASTRTVACCSAAHGPHDDRPPPGRLARAAGRFLS
jgi:hypothetical protein